MFVCISFLRTRVSLINTDNLWSDSLTKDVLKAYAEGLVCNNFDKKTIYNVRRHDEYAWYVLNKAAGDESELISINCFLIEYVRLSSMMVKCHTVVVVYKILDAMPSFLCCYWQKGIL